MSRGKEREVGGEGGRERWGRREREEGGREERREKREERREERGERTENREQRTEKREERKNKEERTENREERRKDRREDRRGENRDTEKRGERREERTEERRERRNSSTSKSTAFLSRRATLSCRSYVHRPNHIFTLTHASAPHTQHVHAVSLFLHHTDIHIVFFLSSQRGAPGGESNPSAGTLHKKRCQSLASTRRDRKRKTLHIVTLPLDSQILRPWSGWPMSLPDIAQQVRRTLPCSPSGADHVMREAGAGSVIRSSKSGVACHTRGQIQ
eukprot:1246256-Rhodomonas_salina.1